MDLTLLGIVMLARLVQPENVLLLMEERLEFSPNVTLLSFVQS